MTNEEREMLLKEFKKVQEQLNTLAAKLKELQDLT
jgi:hypothetical protein